MSETQNPPEAVPSEPAQQKTGPIESLSRRAFFRVAAILATLGLGDTIAGSPLYDHFLKNTQEAEAIPEAEAIQAMTELEEKLAQDTEEAITAVEENHPDLPEKEKAMKVIDYLGCAVFAYGVSTLLGGKSIAALHYGMFSAIMAAKYSLSGEEERAQLMEEFRSSAKAGGIISGTVALAEGVRADLDTAYERIANHPMEDGDRVAILTMLSAATSPAITTVGSATLTKKMALELAKGDHNKMAVMMQYVSNSSGFLLFGDPPFIAICEKYGFEQGVLWQARTMWPLAIYTLMSSAYKINYLRAKEEGQENVASWAGAETWKGMRKNFPILRTIILASLKNCAKFYGGLGLMGADTQAKEGLQFEVDKILSEKWEGISRLFKGEMDSASHHEDLEGLQGASPQTQGAQALMKNVFEASLGEQERDEAKISELHRAIVDSNFDEIQRIAEELKIDAQVITPLLSAAREMQASHTPRDPEEKKRPWTVQAYDYMDYLTNLDNVKGALGHNLGDILNVFPFQAGCVPFLTTAFKDIRTHILQLLDTPQFEKYVTKDSRNKEGIMKVMMFFLIMGFSSIADNYVACKIGLELFPDEPEAALVPSVIGGGLSSVGNMANLALFNLEQMPLASSFAKDVWHVDIATAGIVWSQILPKLQSLPGFKYILGEGMGKNAAA